MLGLSSSLVKGGASLLTFVKDNLKLYLDFKSNKSDTLKFPSEGSTEFNGSSDYIETSDSADFDFGTGDFSISFWFNVDDIDWNWAVSRVNSANSNDVFRAGINNSGKIIFRDIAGGVDVAGSTTISINTWYHFFAVRNSGVLKVYLNSSEDGSASSGGNLDSDKGFRIGRWQGNGDYWNGQLTNVAVWSRALESEEIQSIMNKSYSQLKGVEKTSLVSWWSLDNTEYMRANVSTFMNSIGSTVGTWDLTDGIITVSSHNAYRYFNAYVDAPTYSGANAYIRFEVTAKKTSGSPQLEFEGKTFFDLTTEYQTYTVDVIYENSVGDNFFRVPNASSTDRVLITAFNAYPFGSKDSHGSNNGDNYKMKATTSVYGGNAPILPRAVDVAKEGQADAIGNGSASFNGSTDYVSVATSAHQTTKGTISGWFYPVLNGNQTLFSVGTASAGKTRALFLDGASLKFIGYSADWDTTVDIVTNTWYHLGLTWDGNNVVVYVNGIAYPNSSLTLNTPDGTELKIGTATWTNNYYFDGNISQLGLWQGVLTQSQIQSVMESTSYSKIPADVKSTLGSEILTTNVNTDWSAYGSNDVDNVTDGVKITHVDNAGGAQRTIAGSSGKLYKVVFNAYYSGGTAPNVKVWTGAVNSGTQALTTSSAQYTIYFKNAGTSSLYFDSVNSSQEIFITNLSAKEVTNDIVAYYPLDGSSEVKGLSFDGTDDFIETSSNVGITGASARTLGLWFNPDSVSDTNWLLEWGTQGTARAVSGFYLYQSKIFFYGWTGSGDLDTGTAPLSGWQHLYATYDGTTVKVYLNGSLIGSGARSLETTNTTLKIGAGINTSGGLTSPFSGLISSVSIYNVAKTEDEINSMYQQGIGGDESSNSGLVGYWKLDNGTTVTDLSGNGNNGTVNGGATLISAGTTDSVGNNDGGLL